jgi:integrase
MPRPRKDSVKRWTRYGVDGYVKNVGGRAVSFIGARKKALGFPFTESNRVRCLELHAERVNAERTHAAARRFGIVDHPVVTARHNVGDLLKRYAEMKVSSKSVASIEIFERATGHMLRGADKIPLSETDEIARVLSRNARGPSRRKTRPDRKSGVRPAAPPISPRTLSDYLNQIRAMFSFAMQLGWAARNPCDVVDVPRIPKDRGTPSGHRMIPIEVARQAIERVYAMSEPAAMCLELMLLTGMRDEEVRAMRIHQIRTDAIDVVGKGAAPMPGESEESHRARKPKRIVPLWDVSEWPDHEVTRWQRRMQEIAARAVQSARPTEAAWLFPAITSKDGEDRRPMSEAYLRKYLRKGLKGLVDNPYDYTQHGLRKTCEHFFENVLELDPFDFCDITGHDIVTYVKEYRQKRRPADIMRSITRAAGLEIPVKESAKHASPVDRTHPHTSARNRG